MGADLEVLQGIPKLVRPFLILQLIAQKIKMYNCIPVPLLLIFIFHSNY